MSKGAAFWMVVLTAWTSSISLLTVASKNERGAYDYSPKSVVLLAELFKLCVSGVFLSREVRAGRAAVTLRARSFAVYCLPAAIYFVQNNLMFYALSLLSAPSYQILGNMRILTTALLFRVVLKRELGRHQWTALVMLALGVVACQYDPETHGADASSDGLAVGLYGFAVMLLICSCSALAGVINEFGMKRYKEDSIHLQNLQVYACGIVFNFMNWAREEDAFARGILSGFTPLTYLLLLIISTAGLLVSYILKNHHVIIKVIATSMSLPLTAVASAYLFGTPTNVYLGLGIVLVGAAVLLYSAKSADDFFSQYGLTKVAAALGIGAAARGGGGYSQVAIGPLDAEDDALEV